ncbi:hypothetical protein DEJ48_14835 [Streptomyces venezuelae]|uniref:Uncharacterized protein n=1 Tax=Streptomyces venezuelae TaxID=54571 RepID=A0A5P2BVH5_STRVZ|nr:hypothetical protein [Streptomyces venezuelae]QES34502.1 hypothetical protein DEJ48_14835 [Streptomyces venezuelae]
MSTSFRRLLLALLAVTGGAVGGWAYFAPRNWYDTFPGFGHHWLPVLGPFNEHLVKDVGAMYLALAALSAVAALRVENVLAVQLAGLAWLVFSVPHLIYHLQHLDMYTGVDKVMNVVSLSLFVLAGAALLLPGRNKGGDRAPDG